MNRLIIIITIVVSLNQSAYCEIWPVYSILDLCLKSDEVLEAKFIEEKEDGFVFLTKKFGCGGNFSDTLLFERFYRMILKNPESRYATMPYRSSSEETNLETNQRPYLKIEDLKSGSSLILFVKNRSGKSYPLIGGYRAIYKNLVFNPYRMHTNDRYIFVKTNIQKETIYRTIRRAQEKVIKIKSILNTRNKFLQRIKYRIWLNRNKDELQIKTQFNSCLGWGIIGRFYRYKQKNNGLKPGDVHISELKNYLE